MITIIEETSKNPLALMGKMAGCCWGADISEDEKNIKRALECIDSNHGRVEEAPDVYVIIEGYSAKCIRELYTHIGGSPTRLQASTRYIDYSKGFKAVKPPKVLQNKKAEKVWDKAIQSVSDAMLKLKDLGIPKEDFTNLLPLSYETKMVWKVNLRTLINFMNKRLCSRAYWEIRNLAKELKESLSNYSSEWKTICDMVFVPACEINKICPETKGCGKYEHK